MTTQRPDTAPVPTDQAALWNGVAGQAWVDQQEMLDRLFQPMQDRLLETVGPGSRVLDIGCGTGSTTLGAARLAGPTGACLGVDISEPMLAAARARAEREGLAARFVRADAQAYPFEPASFDRIISRFGVMFFADPRAAFANLRRAAAPGAELCVMAWRGAAENPFMTVAERAAAPFLDALPPRRPDGPGQFAFADPGRVRDILHDAGWTGIDIQRADFACMLPEAGLARYVTRLGPVGLVLNRADEETRERVLAAVHAAFRPYIQGEEVRFTAACWRIAARTSAGGIGAGRRAGHREPHGIGVSKTFCRDRPRR